MSKRQGLETVPYFLLVKKKKRRFPFKYTIKNEDCKIKVFS